MNETKQRVKANAYTLIEKVFANPTTALRLNKMLQLCEVNRDDFIKDVVSYNLIGDEEMIQSNERYRKMASCLTLYFHNLIEDSYHQLRHQITLSFLEQIKSKKIIDVGYGVPGPYLISYLQNHIEASVVLADQDPTAEEFGKLAIANDSPEIESRVHFVTYDMDLDIYPGNADTYIYLDSIEHTKHPTTYLHELVKHALKGSHFIFSIPICSMKGLEAFHYAEWLTNNDARSWIEEANLTIVAEQTAYPNKDVDMFAELLNGPFHNLLLLCVK